MSEDGKTPKSQHARFIEIARKLECDEDKATFDEKLRGIARQKPKADPSKPSD